MDPRSDYPLGTTHAEFAQKLGLPQPAAAVRVGISGVPGVGKSMAKAFPKPLQEAARKAEEAAAQPDALVENRAARSEIILAEWAEHRPQQEIGQHDRGFLA